MAMAMATSKWSFSRTPALGYAPRFRQHTLLYLLRCTPTTLLWLSALTQTAEVSARTSSARYTPFLFYFQTLFLFSLLLKHACRLEGTCILLGNSSQFRYCCMHCWILSIIIRSFPTCGIAHHELNYLYCSAQFVQSGRDTSWSLFMSNGATYVGGPLPARNEKESRAPFFEYYAKSKPLGGWSGSCRFVNHPDVADVVCICGTEVVWSSCVKSNPKLCYSAIILRSYNLHLYKDMITVILFHDSAW